MRRSILAICALATAILALEKVGLYQFVPGDDTGFEYERLPNQRGYALHHANAKGDLTAWLRLVVRSSDSRLSITPTSWSGASLVLIPRPLGADTFELSISKKPSPPKGTPFLWGAGLDLPIVETNGGDFEILDWTVYPNDQAADTRDLAQRRHTWTQISWVLLPLTLLGAVIGAVQEKEPSEPITARTLVERMVNDVVGNDKKETKTIRTFLKKVLLEGVTVGEALTSAGFPDSTDFSKKVPRLQFQGRATNLFKSRLNIVLSELEEYSQRL